MIIDINDNIYKEFKKVMKAKEIAYIYRNNELFFKAKLQKLANELIENEIKRHETHS